LARPTVSSIVPFTWSLFIASPPWGLLPCFALGAHKTVSFYAQVKFVTDGCNSSEPVKQLVCGPESIGSIEQLPQGPAKCG
jgi:hypothetical protein